MLSQLNISGELPSIAIPVLRAGLVVLFASSFLSSGLLFIKRNLPKPLENILRIFARATYLWGIALLGGYSIGAFIIGHEPHLTVLGVCLVLSIFALCIERPTAEMQLTPILTCLTAAVVWFIVILTFGFLPSAGNLNGAFYWGEGPLSVALALTHVGSALVGEGLCLLAFCSSALYLWVYKTLKSNTNFYKYSLPTIQALDKATDKIVFIGWFLMTASLISGFILVLETGSVPFYKMLWACMVWLWYLVTVLGRSALGWKGRKGAYLALFGALLLFIPLFGSIWAGGGSHVAF